MSNTRKVESSSPTATAGKDGKGATPHEILQIARFALEPPKADEVWSSWYRESEDQFVDFQSFGLMEGTATIPGASASNLSASIAPRSSSHRTLSARRISGQFEEEVMKSWDEDWEDEDVEDTFDAIMGQIVRYQASKAAAA
ncbi:uncharacterized protein TM35_000092440 [Trypanosoma theileri]|uniref:Uncharacterized protein n=1 Tax=Trypanosoma theileri TaxID=67003 RepID=A0A1X0NZR9_9TRYP|nr:uncharacterized protein TM35_000092440 [Trypanosoma theileri]ORC90194.1 hypothetical protein TM35_000092440 [Trypanosoma theileri]